MKKRTACVARQFDGYFIEPGIHHNGKLVLGESIGDLCGVKLAYLAYKKSREGKGPEPTIDGFTPEQRFFISLSQIWRVNCREEEIRRLVTVDPHSPGQFRAIGPHVNMQEFFSALKIGPEDKMWRAPELRAKIW